MKKQWVKTLLFAAITGLCLIFVSSVFAAEFKGKISKRYEESKEWWPEPVRPPEGAPNVIIFLLDDVGLLR